MGVRGWSVTCNTATNGGEVTKSWKPLPIQAFGRNRIRNAALRLRYRTTGHRRTAARSSDASQEKFSKTKPIRPAVTQFVTKSVTENTHFLRISEWCNFGLRESFTLAGYQIKRHPAIFFLLLLQEVSKTPLHLFEILEHRRADRPLLLGNPLGLDLALRHPDAVARLKSKRHHINTTLKTLSVCLKLNQPFQ